MESQSQLQSLNNSTIDEERQAWAKEKEAWARERKDWELERLDLVRDNEWLKLELETTNLQVEIANSQVEDANSEVKRRQSLLVAADTKIAFLLRTVQELKAENHSLRMTSKQMVPATEDGRKNKKVIVDATDNVKDIAAPISLMLVTEPEHNESLDTFGSMIGGLEVIPKQQTQEPNLDKPPTNDDQ